jgi:hypothetical protein
MVGCLAEDEVAAAAPGHFEVLDQQLFEKLDDDRLASPAFGLGVDFPLV